MPEFAINRSTGPNASRKFLHAAKRAGRSATLLKVKNFLDAEATVLKHKAGAGRHKGRMGALQVKMADGTRFGRAFVTMTLGFAPRAARAQELETETARLLKAGSIKGGAGVEYQRSADGNESAVPLFLEGGLLDWLELTIEPVVDTRIQPRLGSRAAGPGDVEMTLTGLLWNESPFLPAVALAAEVKVPTARNTSIGTGQYDYAGFLIMSKRWGPVDTHLNGGYTIIGRPPGAAWAWMGRVRAITAEAREVRREDLTRRLGA